jgi:hypothetical protein
MAGGADAADRGDAGADLSFVHAKGESMATLNDLMADGIQSAGDMLLWSLSDFSDVDMLARSVPNANHAAWQLGHLINSTAGMASMCGVKHDAALPSGFADKYKKATASIDDAGAFDSKAFLTGEFKKLAAAMAAFARTATPEQLAQPAPEKIRSLAATMGHLLPLTIGHFQMHNGQIQVIRRTLGKPNLF